MNVDEFMQAYYTCDDPECTATHVDLQNVPIGTFVEAE